MTSEILKKIERINKLNNLKGICPRLLNESLNSYKLNRELLK